MTTATYDPTTANHSSRAVAAVRRVAALARAEGLLLRRNPMALLVAALMPVAMVMLFRVSMPPEVTAGGSVGGFVVTSLTGATLILVVYYNLVTALVARREELVLKRLRTGELSDGEIIVGTVAPAVAIAWGQILLGVVAAVAVFGLQMPTNPFLVVAAVGGGTTVFVLLALVSAALTRTVHMAELTTTPVLVASMALSGLMLPVEHLPGPLAQVAQLLPLTPVVTLVRLGLTGTTEDEQTVGLAGSFEAAVVPLLVLAAWIAVGLWLARRWFRWEPRR
jgi:ABC-2 type transport system permease protein